MIDCIVFNRDKCEGNAVKITVLVLICGQLYSWSVFELLFYSCCLVLETILFHTLL